MKPIDTIRTQLIDKLLSIQNADFLRALDNLVSSSSKVGKVVLSSDQIEMLELSEIDIAKGSLISQEKLDEEDKEWLKRK